MVGYALGTGGFIATYTLLDGLGARASGSAHGYVVWVSLTGSVAIVAVILLIQRGRPRRRAAAPASPGSCPDCWPMGSPGRSSGR